MEEKTKAPPSRGIKSKEALHFVYDKLPMSLNARWEAEDVLKIVFPPHLQRAQYEIALKLILFLKDKEEASGHEVTEWAKAHNVPNSTLRNLVIPKLKKMGLIALGRRNPTGTDKKDKRHPMVLTLSKRFGEALQHIGKQWSELVETWRAKRKIAEKQT